MAQTCCLWTPISISASPASGYPGKDFSRPATLSTVVSTHQNWLKDKQGQESQKLQVHDSERISRRKTMVNLTAGVVVLISGEAAEARVGRQENRRKALEKLRERTEASGPSSGNPKKERSTPPAPQDQAFGPLVEAYLYDY
ncbi:PREDICTED: uncharacterized protein LOC104824142 [Tarenaya hassleriana]|uniref:uncharacterized protein LOC104824142 n=1 Tax=Tarenaya hassleriana TaxID=28532 RepID=UPI00053C2350|nr:PREDICTED: uncharacterized protein LOC104824142 [Tarenaya hassleriana]